MDSLLDCQLLSSTKDWSQRTIMVNLSYSQPYFTKVLTLANQGIVFIIEGYEERAKGGS